MTVDTTNRDINPYWESTWGSYFEPWHAVTSVYASDFQLLNTTVCVRGGTFA